VSIRVLTISKPYVASAYRDKIRMMAADPRFEVGLICPPDWAGQAFENSPADPKEPFFCRQVPIIWNGKNHFHYYRGLRSVLKEFRPHVVNVEEEHYSFVTFQCFREALAIGARPLFYTWQNILKKYPPPFNWIENYVFRHAMAGIVGNDEAGAILRHKGYKGPVEKIPQMGINENMFPIQGRSPRDKNELKSKLNLEPNRPWVLYCGRLVREKGILTLIEACNRLGHQGFSLGLVLLGQGPELDELKGAASNVHTNVTVQFAPFVPSHQVPDWMGAAEVLCLPSLTRSNWKEQFGRVLVEAMASSTVVVGSSSGEIPLVIGDAGLVFPEGKADELAERLTRLFSHHELMESYKQRGLQRARESFTNRVIAGKLCELIWNLHQN
jgi:glycosyltransferase involved in cell wall biosynthesis